MATAIYTGSPSPGVAATGLSNQKHCLWLPNYGGWAVFYLTGTQVLSVKLSTDGTTWTAPASPSTYTLTRVHGSEGRNFGFYCANVASSDVIHMASGYLVSTTAYGYHSRFTLTSAALTTTNSEFAIGGTPGSSLVVPEGCATSVSSDGYVFDLCSYPNTGGNQGDMHIFPFVTADTTAASWSPGTTPAGTSGYVVSSAVTSNAIYANGSASAFCMVDNSPSTAAITNVGSKVWSGSFGSSVTAYSSNFASTTTEGWGSVKVGSNYHVVAKTGASAYSHVIYTSSWAAGNTVTTSGAPTYPTTGGVALVTNGTNVWLFVPTSTSINYCKWTASVPSWGAWTALETGRTNAPSFVSAAINSAGTAIQVIWTEHNGSNYEVWTSKLALTTAWTPGVTTVGSYSESGIASTLNYASHLISSSPGTYLESGLAETTVHGNFLSAGKGAYSESGVASILVHGRSLAAAKGFYACSGSGDSTALKHFLSDAVGVYSGAGSISVLASLRHVPGGLGSYQWSGFATTLPHVRILVAATGAFSDAGVASSLVHGYPLPAGLAGYSEVGLAETQRSLRHVPAFIGSYVSAGPALAYKVAYHLGCATGVYLGTGVGIGLVRSKFLVLGLGVCSESCAGAIPFYGSSILGAKGVYSESGIGAAISSGLYISFLNGHYSEFGQPGTLTWSHSSNVNTLAGIAGTYSELGIGADPGNDSNVLALTGSYLIGIESHYLLENASRRLLESSYYRILQGFGNVATLRRGLISGNATGSYSVYGMPATLVGTHQGVYSVFASTGSYSGAGFGVSFLARHAISGAKGSYGILASNVNQVAFATGVYSSVNSGAFSSRVVHKLVGSSGVYTNVIEYRRLLQSLSRRLLENRAIRILEQASNFNESISHGLIAKVGVYPSPAFTAGIYSVSGLSITTSRAVNFLTAKGSYSEVGVVAIVNSSNHLFGSLGVYVSTAESHRLLENISNRLLENSSYYILESPPLRPNLVHGYANPAFNATYSYSGLAAFQVHANFSSCVRGFYSESGQQSFSQHVNHVIASTGTYAESAAFILTRGSWHLTGTMAAYGEAGVASTLVHARLVALASGILLESGKPASIIHGRLVSSQLGSYIESGLGISLLRSIKLASGTGIYAESSQPATILKSVANANTLLTSAGVYSESSVFESTSWHSHSVASMGGYSETGKPSTPAHAIQLSLAVGSYTESGRTLVSVLSRRLASATGQILEIGFGLSSLLRHFLSDFEGVYAESGRPIATKAAYHLIAIPGVYSESGSLASFLSLRHLLPAAGHYSESGFVSTQLHANALVAANGSYSEGGFGANFVRGYVSSELNATYTYHGIVSAPVRGHPVFSVSGSYSLVGRFADLTHSTVGQGQVLSVNASTGSYAGLPVSAGIKSLRHLLSAAGNYVSLGRISSGLRALNSILFAGIYDETGRTEFLLRGHFLGSGFGVYQATGFPLTTNQYYQYIVSASNLLNLHPSSTGGFDHSVSSSDAIILSSIASGVVVRPPPETPTREARSQFRLRPQASSVITRRDFVELGRFRHGDKIRLSVTLPGVPDSAPIATVFLDGPDQLIGAYPLPSIDSTNLNFALSLQMSLGFPFGTYLVSYQFAIGGIQGVIESAQFQVIPGGDAGGEAIFMYSLDRPEATFVLTQLDSGRLCVGRNPSIGIH